MGRPLTHVLFPVLILCAVLALTLAMSPLTTGPAAVAPVAPAHAQAPTPTPSEQEAGKSQPGSTDSLVVMGFAIAAIVVLPLLLQRKLWMK